MTSAIDLTLIQFVVAQSEAVRQGARAWTAEEDQFLRDNLGYLTDQEIGQALGRTATAVHLRWDRDLGLPGPSRAPGVLTATRAAKMLGIDGHKIVGWVDCGLIPGRLMAGAQTKCHTIRLIDRQAFRRWVLNPMHWMYFDRRKVKDPELKRMLRLRAQRWGDAWWTTRQVADYHDVGVGVVDQQIRRGQLRSFRLPVPLGGRNWDRRWSNHFILKSDALQARFIRSRGGNKKISKFTPAADRWILKARDKLDMTFVAIGRTMKIGKERDNMNQTIAYRYRQLKARATKRKPIKR